MDEDDSVLDALVLRELRSGNRQVYGILIDRYQQPIRALVSAFLRDSSEIERLVRQVFVRAYAQRDDEHGSSGFLVRLQALAMELLVEQTASTSPSNDAVSQVVSAHARTVGDGGATLALIQAIDRCFPSLTAEAQALLADRYQSDDSLTELAARHRTSEAALAQRLFDLRDRLGICAGHSSTAGDSSFVMLMCAVLDGEADAETCAHLTDTLHDDDPARQRFLTQVAIAGILRARFLPAQRSAAFRRDTLAALDATGTANAGAEHRTHPTTTTSQQRRRWRPSWRHVAATILLIVWLGIVIQRRNSEVLLAATDDPAASLIRDGVAIPITPGIALHPGDRLSSVTKAQAMIFTDGSLVVLLPASEVVVEQVTPARHLRLLTGQVQVEVKVQAQPLLATTRRVSLMTNASRFRLSTGTSSDFAAVQSGSATIRQVGQDATHQLIGRQAVVIGETLLPVAIVPTSLHQVDGWNGSGTGLRGDYYRDPAFTDLAATRIDPLIRFEWPGSPDEAVPADRFQVRWNGRIQPRVSGVHTFSLRADDGARLWIDGRTLIDTWDEPNIAERHGDITLDAGRLYDLQLDFYDRDGAAEITLWWQAPGQAKEVVPTVQLYPP